MARDAADRAHQVATRPWRFKAAPSTDSAIASSGRAGIVPEIARGTKFSSKVAAAALQKYLAGPWLRLRLRLGREDDAAIAKVYARNAGLTLPKKDV
jgi:hypothetical protein